MNGSSAKIRTGISTVGHLAKRRQGEGITPGFTPLGIPISATDWSLRLTQDQWKAQDLNPTPQVLTPAGLGLCC